MTLLTRNIDQQTLTPELRAALVIQRAAQAGYVLVRAADLPTQ